MPLVLPIKTIDKLSALKEPEEFRKAVFNMVNVGAIDIFLNRVLTIVYISYEKTPGGIIKPSDTKAEDIYQGKVALVLKVGPTAFDDSPGFRWEEDARPEPGDWVTFKIGNSSQIEIQKVACRIVADSFIETRVKDPRMVTS